VRRIPHERHHLQKDADRPAARRFPAGAAATAGRAAELPVWRYTVRPGDTLINIAERYLIEPGSGRRAAGQPGR
jgi:hypothetical protein